MHRLILVRHGATESNLHSRFGGHTDVGLTPLGEKQAAALAAPLEALAFDEVYCSDLRRAVRTAEIALRGRGLSIECSPALREMSFGRWEGLTYEEAQALDHAAVDRWVSAPALFAPPEGETIEQLQGRVVTFVREVLARRASVSALFVVHGGPIRVLLCALLGIDISHQWQFQVGNASISIVELYEPGAILIRLNDICHLGALKGEF